MAWTPVPAVGRFPFLGPGGPLPFPKSVGAASAEPRKSGSEGPQAEPAHRGGALGPSSGAAAALKEGLCVRHIQCSEYSGSWWGPRLPLLFALPALPSRPNLGPKRSGSGLGAQAALPSRAPLGGGAVLTAWGAGRPAGEPAPPRPAPGWVPHTRRARRARS